MSEKADSKDGYALSGRRAFLRRAAALGTLGLAAALPGCDAGASAGATELRFWNGFTGPDGRTILKLVKRFNRDNPDVRVTVQRMEWNTYYNKLFVAGLDGRSPEVFVCHARALGRMQHAKLLRPMGDLYADAGGTIPADDFDPNVLAGSTFDGKRFAVPLDIHPLGMFYNKALFRQAGLVDAAGQVRVPTDRASFVEAATRISALPEANGSDTYGFAFTWMRLDCMALMYQFGGKVLAADGSPDPLTSPADVAAMEFARNGIIEAGLAPTPQTLDSFIGFRQGRLGMIFQGIFVLPELERQGDLDFGAAPLPTLGTQPATWMDSHTLCLRPDLAGAELEASKRFLRFLSDNSLEWATGGQVPARRSLRDTPAFREMTAQYAFSQQIPYGVYSPQVDYVFELENEFDLAVEKILRGDAAPAAALAAAQKRIEAARQRYVV